MVTSLVLTKEMIQYFCLSTEQYQPQQLSHTLYLACLSLVQFNAAPILERSHDFCSKSLNSLGSSVRIGLDPPPLFLLFAHTFSVMLPTAENNIKGLCLSMAAWQRWPWLCHLSSPSWHEVDIDQKFWIIQSRSNFKLSYCHRTCQIMYTNFYVKICNFCLLCSTVLI